MLLVQTAIPQQRFGLTVDWICRRLALVLCFALAFPIYAFRSRGLGGFLLLLQAALMVALMVGAIVASTYLVVATQEWRGF